MDGTIRSADEYPDELDETEAAAYLGTLITQIYRWQDAGVFGRWEETPNGRRWRVRRAELDAWLAQEQAAQQQRLWEDEDAPTT